jgi:hypothetical protein
LTTPTWTIFQGETEYVVVVYVDNRPEISAQSPQATSDNFSLDEELTFYQPMAGIVSQKCGGNLLDIDCWLSQQVQRRQDKAFRLECEGVDVSPFLPSVPDGSVA